MKDETKKTTSIITLTICALGIALTYVCALIGIPIPGASGGYFHLGNLPIFVFAIIYGPRVGAIVGAFGLGLFDLLSPYAIWAPFTIVISLIMGYVCGKIVSGDKITPLRGTLGILACVPIKVVGYYLAELILYGNPYTPIASIYSNVIQIVACIIVVVPVTKLLKIARVKWQSSIVSK